MTANPYDHFVGTEDPIAVIAATPGRLQAALDRLGPERCTQSTAPGKWSPYQVTAHMVDCELMHGVRLREALADDNPTIHPFDQDVWATRHSAYAVTSQLPAFTAMRAWNLALIQSLSAADRARNLTHPERGSFTIETLLRTIAGHDLNHILALEALPLDALNHPSS